MRLLQVLVPQVEKICIDKCVIQISCQSLHISVNNLAPGHNAPLIQFLISALYTCILFTCSYRMLSSYPFLHFFLTYLLPYLPFLFRIDPLHFQAGCLRRRLKLALVFVFILCCSTFLLIGECVLFVLGLVFFILSQEFCWGTYFVSSGV